MAIKFDLSEHISKIKNLSKAELSICYISGSAGEKGSKLHPITKEISISESSWMEYAKGKKWSIQGGDYDFAKSSFADYAAKPKGWETFDILNFINDIVEEPKKNNGFLIICDEGVTEMNMGRFYASSENEDTSLRPKLFLKYTSTGITNVLKTGHNKFSITQLPGRVTVTLTKTDNVTVQMTNAQGKRVFRKTVKNTNVVTIPLQTVSFGLYFLNIKSNTETQSIRFIYN